MQQVRSLDKVVCSFLALTLILNSSTARSRSRHCNSRYLGVDDLCSHKAVRSRQAPTSPISNTTYLVFRLCCCLKHGIGGKGDFSTVKDSTSPCMTLQFGFHSTGRVRPQRRYAMPSSSVLGFRLRIQCLHDSKPQTGLACLDLLAKSAARLLRDDRDIMLSISRDIT